MDNKETSKTNKILTIVNIWRMIKEKSTLKDVHDTLMKRTLKWVVGSILLLLLLLVPYSFFSNDIKNLFIDKPDLSMVHTEIVKANNFDDEPAKETVERVEAEERIRFLLLGTDERKNEAARSDTIVLATYYPNEGKMNLLSIPRDTKVHIPGQEKEDKINSAHALGGMDLIKQTVSEWSGLKIDHVAKVNFNGFKELVDEAGGVTVNAKKTLSYGGITIQPGKQKLTGEEALTYVRFRKDEDGDFGRIKRQQEVIQNTLSAVLSDFNPLSIPSYLNFYRKHVESDMAFSDMYHIAKTAYSNGVKLEGKTIKTSSSKDDGIWYENVDEQQKEVSLAWLEQRPEEVIPSPHEVTEHIPSHPRISGQLETP